LEYPNYDHGGANPQVNVLNKCAFHASVPDAALHATLLTECQIKEWGRAAIATFISREAGDIEWTVDNSNRVFTLKAPISLNGSQRNNLITQLAAISTKLVLG
jgi:hypothetical protein